MFCTIYLFDFQEYRIAWNSVIQKTELLKRTANILKQLVCSVTKSWLAPCNPTDCNTSGFPCGSADKEIHLQCLGDLSSIRGLGRSPGEGHSKPLQYSGLENPMDCIVHGVAKSRTRLSNFHFLSLFITYAL